MKFELKTYNRNITNEDLLNDLKKVAKELGKETIIIEEYNKKGKYSIQTFAVHFGSWNNALKNAGLTVNHPMRIEIEDLFKNIEEVWLTLGKQPGRRDMIPPISKYSEVPYKTRFGTWSKALEQFVEYINSEDIETEATIISKSEISPRHKTKRDINWRLRFLVMRRDNFKCNACGKSPTNNPGTELHIDHIIAWDKGGETVFENLQTLCSVCNIGKSNLDFRADTELLT